MRATDRSLDVIAFVSEHFRDIIRRRLSELAGLALITLSVAWRHRARHLVRAGSVPQPRDAEADPQSAWLPRRDFLRPRDAAARPRRHPAAGAGSAARLASDLTQAGRRKMAQPAVDRRDVPGGRIRLHVAAHRIVAASDRTWRRCGRCGACACLRWIFGSPLGGFTRLILCIVFGLATAATWCWPLRAPDHDEKRAARRVDEEDEIEEKTKTTITARHGSA